MRTSGPPSRNIIAPTPFPCADWKLSSPRNYLCSIARADISRKCGRIAAQKLFDCVSQSERNRCAVWNTHACIWNMRVSLSIHFFSSLPLSLPSPLPPLFLSLSVFLFWWTTCKANPTHHRNQTSLIMKPHHVSGGIRGSLNVFGLFLYHSFFSSFLNFTVRWIPSVFFSRMRIYLPLKIFH